MTKTLEGKVAVVTGAARGIGKAVAQRYFREGASLYLIDINEENLMQFEVPKGRDQKVKLMRADVSDSRDVERCVEDAYSFFSSIDIVASIAGIAYETPFLEISEAELDKVLDVNLKGMFLVCQKFAKPMAKDPRINRNGGYIITMGSKNGLAGEPGYTHYDASKAGIIGLTRTMAAELAPYNINVNCICPGYISTPLTLGMDGPKFEINLAYNLIPGRRVGNLDDLTGVMVFLATKESRWMKGQAIVVDGGQISVSGDLPRWYKDRYSFDK